MSIATQTAAPGHKADPLETSLTTLQQRLSALQLVKQQREIMAMMEKRHAASMARERARLSEAEANAERIGAFDCLPPELRNVRGVVS